MAKGRIILFITLILALSTLIGWVFWKQELQYALPTPIPANFVDIQVGDTVDLSKDLLIKSGNPTLLHFFNADCPCSRFNMRDFESLAHKFKGQIDFFVVIQSSEADAAEKFKNKYDLDIPTILDKDGIISDKCGIYATPQAVLLNKNAAVYFKGNYNKARFCTRKETKFVELAIGHLLKNEALPLSIQYAMTEPYGCSLPSDEVDINNKTGLAYFGQIITSLWKL